MGAHSRLMNGPVRRKCF